jgi:hypothetical protein
MLLGLADLRTQELRDLSLSAGMFFGAGSMTTIAVDFGLLDERYTYLSDIWWLLAYVSILHIR